MPNKAIFLDRDGTINKEKNYLINIQEFDYLPYVVDSLKELQAMGFLLIIVTNQSGIARGFYAEEEYLVFQKWIEDDLKSKGINITKTYYCPHLESGIISEYAIDCDCRKPKLGLFYKAQKDFDIDFDGSYAIGDKERDVFIADSTGVRGIILGEIKTDKYKTCNNWLEVVEYIKNSEKDDYE